MNGEGRARACANIALVKYWGKIDEARNLPAVPSVSVTLDALVTTTTVRLDPDLAADQVVLDGCACAGEELQRLAGFLDLVRARAGRHGFARVSSDNGFPTASGLASSASGFAALAAAAARAYGLDQTPAQLSALARRGSVSAARSVHGGFVLLPAGVPGDDTLSARPLHPPGYLDIAVVIALVTRERKATGSRAGMRASATSPLWAGWLGSAPGYAFEATEALRTRDLERLGRVTEASTFAMHACAWAAVPPLRYFRPATVALLDRVEGLRRAGTGAWCTMDAGPHVKVLCASAEASAVAAALREVPGVVEVLIAHPGEGVA